MNRTILILLFLVYAIVSGALLGASDGGMSILSALACPWVYDLTVGQDEDCDGVNIVTVCYSMHDPDGDLIESRFSVSRAGTPIPATTITNDVPGYSGSNLGILSSGRYCFNWHLSTDYPDAEGCNFVFRIDIENETTDILNVIDSFPILDAEGVAWDGTNLWVTRSTFITGDVDTHFVWRVNPATLDTTFYCDLTGAISGYKADCTWHDGRLYCMGGGLGGSRGKIYRLNPTTCVIEDSSAAIIPHPRWGQGIDYFNGNFYCCDSRGKIYRVNPSDWSSSLWLDFEDSTVFVGSATANALVFALGYIWILRNPGPDNHILIQVDTLGAIIDSFALATTASHGPEGITWDGSCFWYTDHADDWVYRICLELCTDSVIATGVCLDSWKPRVSLTCPSTDSITVGEPVNLSWTITDLNFEPPCSIFVSGCGFDTTLVGVSSPFSFDLPYSFSGCSEVWLHLRAWDSYCNMGSDSCRIYPRTLWNIVHQTPPSPDSGFVSCDDQQIRFLIEHSCPIDWDVTALTINGSTVYSVSDSELSFDGTHLVFSPSAGYWTSGRHSYRLVIEDICGNSYDELFDLDIDVDPPIIFNYEPIDTVYTGDSISIGFVVRDEHSGIGSVSVSVTSSCGVRNFGMGALTRTTIATGDSFATPLVFCEGENTVCVTADDQPYLCEPNSRTQCWDFFIPPTGDVNAEVVVPIDLNEDGRVITNCNNQLIAWYVTSDYDIDPNTIRVSVCGIEYTYPNPRLLFRGDTIYFLPTETYTPGDSCHFCLNDVEDIIGSSIDEPVCGYLIYDGRAPELESRVPAIDSIFDESAIFDASFIDEICDSVIVDSVWVTTTISRISNRYASFPFEVEGFVHGDTVRICAYISDDCADYCGVNRRTVCWFYQVLIGGPEGRVIEPVDVNSDGIVVTACTTQVITIGFYDELGMDPSRNIRMYIRELDRYFRTDDFDITTADGGDSMYITLDIASFGLDWLPYDGEYIHFTVDSAFNIYGLWLVSPIIDSFRVDFSPPEVIHYTPYTLVFDSATVVTAEVEDAVCETALVDSLIATVYPGSRTVRILAATGTIVGLRNGDSVHVCAYARDVCHDYCGPNETSFCWSFGARLSALDASIIYPIDVNRDDRIISTCANQGIAWYIHHTQPIVVSEISVVVDGRRYNYPSHLTFRNDTLYFTPSAPWRHGDTVEFCIRHLEDEARFSVSDVGCGHVVIDLNPPEVFLLSGTGDGEVINSTTASGTFYAVDDYCSYEPIDSIRITSSEGLDTLFRRDSYTIDGLSDGEVVRVCAYSNQECQDYSCPMATGSLCIEYEVLLGSLSATIIEPVDLNIDGRIVSGCPGQEIVWEISHEFALVESTIAATVDGVPYYYPDHLDLLGDILTFTPSALYEDGDSIAFCLDFVMDETGVGLPAPVCGYFIMNLSPPIISVASGPVDGSIHYAPTMTGRLTAFDHSCGETAIDSIRITSSISGLEIRFIGDFYDISDLVDGDIVSICAWANNDDCLDYICDETISEYCFEVSIALSGLSADIIMPVDVNGDGRVITNCTAQQIRWLIRSEHGIDLLSIEVSHGLDYFTYPIHLSLSGDTLIFSHPSPYSAGDTVPFCLLSVSDTLGTALSTPVCGEMIFDLTPPELVFSAPASGSTIYADSAIITADFIDVICDSLIEIYEIWATASPSGAGTSVSTSAFPLTIRNLEGGDTVTVCTYLADNCADYCGNNADTVCFDFYVALGELSASIIAPGDRNDDGRIISACDDMGFLVRFHDINGVSDADIHFTVAGIGYTGADFAELYFDPDSTTLYGLWTPPAPWTSGDWVVISIDTAYNLLGDMLDAPIVDSFLIDTEGPEIIYSGPLGTHGYDTASISASAVDDICMTAILDSMVISIEPAGITIARDWSDTTLIGLSNGDIVEICLYTHDNCADTCGFNYSDSCISFGVDLGHITAGLLEPIDINGDGRVISNCDDQSIRWLVNADTLIDPLTVIVVVCGDTFDISSSELTVMGDTIIWTPVVAWTNGEACDFSLLAVCDIRGSCLAMPVEGDLLVNLSPPFLSDIQPPIDEFIGDGAVFNAALHDSICIGDDFLDSLVVIAYSDDGYSRVTHHSIPTGTISWGLADSVSACYYLSDDCADYCDDNVAIYCYWYYPYPDAPVGRITQPRDVNGDGIIITACDNQGVRFVITDPSGMSTVGIGFSVNGIAYTEADAGVSLIDSATVVVDWLPSVLWESGDTVDIVLTDAQNIHGTPLSSPFHRQFIVDLEPPLVFYTGPSGTYYSDSATIEIEIEDLICDTADIVIDSVVATSDISGLHENFGGGSHAISGFIDGFVDGDSVIVSVWARDACADTCGYNDTLAVFGFVVAMSDINARVIPPAMVHGIVSSACDDQPLRWLTNSTLDLDLSSIEISIDGILYDFDSGYLSMMGDTLVFSPDVGFWESGVYRYCLNQLCDIEGGCIASLVCDSIIIDLDPPVFSMISPQGATTNTRPAITVNIADSLSGLAEDMLVMVVNGDTVSAELSGVRFRYVPDYDFECGSFVEVAVYAMDNPDLCDANHADTSWIFGISCAPNITASNPQIIPDSDITEGDDIIFSGIISNDDVMDLNDIPVAVLIDGELVEMYYIDLARNEADTVYHHFSNLAGGSYELCIYADYGNTIDESNEFDNEICISLLVVSSDCDVQPNPFTPDGDGIYDETFFLFPGMGGHGFYEIEIFDINNRPVRKLRNERMWDGRDNSGRDMHKGVYIYIVIVNGEVECHGTVHIAR